MPTPPIHAYLCGNKGLSALGALALHANAIGPVTVIAAGDPGVAGDPLAAIQETARGAGFATLESPPPVDSAVGIAVGWRWLIHRPYPALYVVHDSLLPRLRGWNPLVTALIEGDPEIGATLIRADAGMDTGSVVASRRIPIDHPMRISDAIDRICLEAVRPLVGDLAEELARGNLPSGQPQEAKEATYSLWRDDDDYWVNWADDATRIVRHILASGPPYAGARTTFADTVAIVVDARVAQLDGPIVNATPGKVFALQDGRPTIVCGQGLVEIIDARDAKTGESLLPVGRLRQRASTPRLA